jgi:ArsR family transcriptional regulator, arsenate/arsenite/antimonite-responsive transcriptional repressor
MIPYFYDYRIVRSVFMEQTAAKTIEALSALAQEHRLALFRLLVQAGAEGMAAGAIAAALDVPASSLSFHLAHMERAGIVQRLRRGRSLIYSADYAAMNRLVGYLMENCCAGDAHCASASTCSTIEERQVA